MSDASAQTLRQLKIKTNVVKRLFREEEGDRQEADERKNVRDKLVSEGADGADIRNADRVWEDAHKMIAITGKKLQQAVEELEDLVTALEKDETTRQTDEWEAADRQMKQVHAAWASKANGH